MIPYASTHGRRYRRRRFIPGAGMPRFAHFASVGCFGLSKGVKGFFSHSRAGNAIANTRHIRLLSVAQRLRPLPPMVGERHWFIIRRWRFA